MKAIESINPTEISEFLSRACGNVVVTPTVAGEMDVRVESMIVFGAMILRIKTKSGCTFSFESPIDGRTLIILEAGSLRAVAKDFVISRSANQCTMLDTTGTTQWILGSGGYEMLLVPACDLNRRLSAMMNAAVIQPIEFPIDISIDSDPVVLVRTLAQALRIGANAGQPQARASATIISLYNALLTALLERFPHSYSERLKRKGWGPCPRHVRRAVEFAHANAKGSVSVDDMARAAGTSVRSLQTGFSRFCNTSPMAYLKQIRLEGVRQDLASADHSVMILDVARQWGFSHLGLFAKAYRNAFGELPSETRMRGPGVRKSVCPDPVLLKRESAGNFVDPIVTCNY